MRNDDQRREQIAACEDIQRRCAPDRVLSEQKRCRDQIVDQQQGLLDEDESWKGGPGNLCEGQSAKKRGKEEERDSERNAAMARLRPERRQQDGRLLEAHLRMSGPFVVHRLRPSERHCHRARPQSSSASRRIARAAGLHS